MKSYRKKYTKKRVTRRRPTTMMRYRKPAIAPQISYYPALPTKGNMSKTGVPNIMSVQLKSFDNIAVAPGAVAIQAYAIKLTSTFDPLGDASAVQPVARDQLAALYGSYIVDSGSVKLTFVTTTATPVTMACYTSAAAQTAADINNYCGQPGSVYKTCAAAGGGTTNIVLKRSFKSRQILGPLDRSSHGGAIGGDPTSMAYLYVFIKCQTQPLTGMLLIESVQNTTFYDKTAVIHA
nr:MAG: putative capsid protein [Arizlama virus]